MSNTESGSTAGDAAGRHGYRTCSECGRDCDPEPTALDGLGVRIVFTCPTHGIHSVIDPFESRR